MYPIVIIGSGMAAYSLVREFRKLNQEQEIVMICADQAVQYAKPTLSNALALKKKPEQIALAHAEKMQTQLNIEIKTQSTVQKINTQQHKILIEKDGIISEHNYSKLVLAVGAKQIQAHFAGNAANQVHRINHLDDYVKFHTQLEQKSSQRIVILGAGLIGCEFANDLQLAGHQVSVVDLANSPLSQILPEKIGSILQTKLEKIGIEFIFNQTITAVDCTENQQYLVQLNNEQTITADLVLSAIGLQPNIDLAKQSDIATQKGICTNSFLETNQENIYAIGDCVEVNDLFLPYVMPIMQQARALAKTLNQEKTAVHYPAMPVAIKTPAAPLTVLIPTKNITYSWQIEETENGLIARALDVNQTLQGFILLGTFAAKQRLSLTKLIPDLIPIQS